MLDNKFHPFSSEELSGTELPKQFTFPFHYIPHHLCICAAQHVQAHLYTHPEWQNELHRGKMMGVLVVKKDNNVGYLAAFSGNLAHSNNHDFFVPAVYDLLAEHGFFRPEEEQISAINKLIADETICAERQALIDRISTTEKAANEAIDNYRTFMKEAKALRDLARSSGEDTAPLIAESQFQKAELKRIQSHWNAIIEELRHTLAERDARVAAWKAERQQRSAALQERIFHHFVMLNAHGESKDLCEIFADTPQHTPPGGAGECAAPKLLQYAYANGYQPLAMAEFWIGESPKEEIRRHGCFYPSCRAKCEPILGWMLKGLDVEPNPLEHAAKASPLEVLYEDEWLLAVNKPAGVMSVPGKLSTDSMVERVRSHYTSDFQPLPIHRLDMATSGVLLFAKSMNIYTLMQHLFKSRKVQKRYIAILAGIITNSSGVISLPLILNPKERPLQMVNHVHGKSAITEYEVIERTENTTRIAFYPKTGRTHQLRVHAAHPDGLNAPIVGDTLYGTHAERLYLHAESVDFIHPITGRPIHITTPPPF